MGKANSKPTDPTAPPVEAKPDPKVAIFFENMLSALPPLFATSKIEKDGASNKYYISCNALENILVVQVTDGNLILEKSVGSDEFEELVSG